MSKKSFHHIHKPERVTRQFKISQLVGQFILDKTGMHVPEGWSSERIGGWFLGQHSSLPGIRLLDAEDRPVGWLLGYPIDGNGLLLSEGDAIRVPGLSDSTESSVEEFIYGFGGRFLVALVGVRRPRLYLDPCGSLSVVYCPHKEVIASTPNLIPHDDRTRDRVDLAREMGIPNTNAMYPLTLTPRHNVERLLPNHYLDLYNWQSVRHWPKKALHSEGSVAEAAAAIAAITKRNIAAVIKRTPTYLCLTAGKDSRMLLACARDVADRVELLTVPIPDDDAFIDVAIARKIARRFRLRHFVPQFQKSMKEDLDEWMFRIGNSTGELRGWQATSMFRQANPSYSMLLGNVGEVARAYWSRSGDTKSSRITPERLLEYLGAPCTTLTMSPLQRWLETVPAINAFQILDLYYIEQRLGCWGGIWPYAQSGDPGFIIFPMCHREVIERMLTLPTPYRRSGALMQEVINREWPELLDWPFSEPIGFMRVPLAVRRARRGLAFQAERVRRALRHPGWAAERIWSLLPLRKALSPRKH